MPWADAWASFTLALRAENCSPNTIRGYAQTSKQFVAWAAEQRLSTTPAVITRDTINRFIERISEQWKPATAATRYRALHLRGTSEERDENVRIRAVLTDYKRSCNRQSVSCQMIENTAAIGSISVRAFTVSDVSARSVVSYQHLSHRKST
jgi:hypothetical protein